MSSTSERSDGLDLLRGAAVALVMARHALPGVFGGAGVVGVVMFFSLSGYLITGVLVGEVRRTGRLRLGAFYRRRAARLVPALLLMLTGFTLVTLTLDPIGDRALLPATLAIALTWTGDLPFGHASPATFHLWTLALEEQFYLAWPLLVGWAVRRGRERLLLLVAGLATAVACVASTLWLREAPDLAYALPTSWAMCFVVGAAARLLPLPVPPRWLAVGAAAALGVLSVLPLRGSVFTYLGGGPAIAALTAVLVLALRDRVTVTGRAGRALVWLGVLSYSAYLWNYPLTLWLRPSLGVAAGGLAAVLTVGLAWASHRYVERPALRRLGTPPRERVPA